MTRKSINFFSIIILSIFILSVAWFVVSLSLSAKTEKSKAAFSFEIIIKQIESIIENNDFKQMQMALDLLIYENPSIAKLSISNNNEIFFTYPHDESLINYNITTQVFSKSINFYDNSIAILSCSIYVMNRNIIFNHAKILFILILVSTIITFILILFTKKQNLVVDNKNDSQLVENYIEKKSNIKDDEHIVEELPIYKNNVDDILSFEEDKQIEQLEEIQENYIPVQTMNTYKNNIEPNVSSFENELSIELEKSIASEQDLAVIIFKFEKPNLNNINHLKLFLNDNVNNDLKIFELIDNSIAIILENSDIDKAMTLSEDLFNKIRFDKTFNINENKIAIGISTRSLRLVPAQRIINEAEQAVIRAFNENKVPIVAFKVNPEKYRQFIAEQ
ncbi:MAG: hypothetical protein GX220_07135 [Treponema sp.]|nr:hypothetical protein [Treponema sp.]